MGCSELGKTQFLINTLQLGYVLRILYLTCYPQKVLVVVLLLLMLLLLLLLRLERLNLVLLLVDLLIMLLLLLFS